METFCDDKKDSIFRMMRKFELQFNIPSSTIEINDFLSMKWNQFKLRSE